jgi:hypothetical protein
LTDFATVQSARTQYSPQILNVVSDLPPPFGSPALYVKMQKME